ncbi:MAG: stage II sporulation protein P [Clostridia bacterium]|nr:stage II sporulation protein P [Clostridia bacterium]
MKHKKKVKHHIYTIVIEKKLIGLSLIVFISLIIGWLCSLAIDHTINSNAGIVKSCITYTTHFDKNADSHIPGMKLSLSDILGHASPIFTVSNDTVPAVNLKRPKTENYDDKRTDNTPYTKNGIEEKKIISQNLMLTNATDYTVDIQKMALSDVNYDATGDNPKVLIIHTHGCETYSNEVGTGLGINGSYRTTDTSANMIAIGEILAAKLSERGINVIHDKTMCDYPSYNESYRNSLALIDGYLNKYPDIEFVFDIHRDAIESNTGVPIKLTYEYDNEVSAQVMIVCGTDALGLEHANWRDNLTLASKIQLYMEKNYPGIMRPINLREERFNMHKTKGSLIFEIGTHANTLDEAKKSAVYIADGIAKVLNSK